MPDVMTRKWPLTPLVMAVGFEQVAKATGKHVRTIEKWAKNGRKLDDFEADTLACGFNMHPFELWPEWGQLEPA